MRNRFSHQQLRQRIEQALREPTAFEAAAGDATPPQGVVDWITQLALLQGVPFNYLVPDERMLPPESIRFFYLNMNWIDALVDGAMSIGRNVTATTGTSTAASRLPAVEHVASSRVQTEFRRQAGRVRARALRTVPADTMLSPVSGFLLRSSVVADYPGMGVNAFPAGGSPSSSDVTLLPILRLQILGPQSDTMLCLVDGDVQQYDLHEPPEGLHFGLDSFDPSASPITATKNVWTYDPGDPLTLTGSVALNNVVGCLRATQPRSLIMTAFQQAIAGSVSPPINPVDSAVLGFEMTLGVTQVSFVRRNQA